MDALSRSPVKIILRFQDSPNEDLEVAAAFNKRPHLVRDALLEAIRCVQLQTLDITLLRIESVFHSALKEPWKEPKHLRPVLEACRQGKIASRTEKIFLEHGEEYGVVALSVATKQDDHKLFREIDPLADDELIKLAKNIQRIPKRAAIIEFIEEFAQSPQGVVSDPPPHLPRPRTRKREIPPSPLPTQPDSSNTNQYNKRKRLGSVSDATTQGLPQAESQSPSTDDITFSTACRPPPPPTLPLLQPMFSNYQNLSTSKHANVPQQPPQQPLSGQEGPWAVSQAMRPHMSTNDTQQLQMMSLEGSWEFAEGEFTQGRPSRYEPGHPQWIFTEEFTQGRPYRYDPESVQVGQDIQWLFTEVEFTRGRPNRYDPQSAQVQEQNVFQC